MTSNSTRKHARRFFGTMGAAMRQTARPFETRQSQRADTATRQTHDFFLVRAEASRDAQHLMAR